MEEQREVKTSWGGWQLYVLAVVALLAVGIATSGRPSSYEAEKQRQAVAPAVETARSAGQAPTLRKGKPIRVKGKLMPNYVATGAGDGSYNGIYSQVGGETHNGQPVYRLGGSPTGKALYNVTSFGGFWCLGPTVGAEPPTDAVYCNPTSPLGGPYMDSTTFPPPPITLSGTAPGPTLAEQTPVVPDWPWDYFIDGPYYGPGDRIRPCRATISATPYILFPWQHSGSATLGIAFAEIVTADPLDVTFTRKTWTTSPVFYGDHDPGQTAAAYDAGDGSHIYICSGSYLNGTPFFDFAMWDVTATPPTKGTVDTVALPTVHITPFLQVAADTFRFMCVDGANGKYYEYVAGSGALTLLGTDALPALPVGYTDVACSVDAIGRLDISLYERGGTVYFGRHVVNGTTHRIVENSVAVA